MNHLLREAAPISDAAWTEIDREVRERLVPSLAARRLVDFAGPSGWEHAAVPLGRVTDVDPPVAGLRGRQRRVLALAELRADFSVSRDELRDLDRGAVDLDFDAADDAARNIAEAENIAVFRGWPAAGIVGIAEASEMEPIAAATFTDYPKHVAKAVETLLSAGVGGPYGLALGPEAYTGVIETTEQGGLVVFDHLREILGGPIVRAVGVNGAIVLSQRGGDFLFESGEDLSLGYDSHDADNVYLYLEESFTFRVATPEAAVALR